MMVGSCLAVVASRRHTLDTARNDIDIAQRSYLQQLHDQVALWQQQAIASVHLPTALLTL